MSGGQSYQALVGQLKTSYLKLKKKLGKNDGVGVESCVLDAEKLAKEQSGTGEGVALLQAARMRNVQGDTAGEAEGYLQSGIAFMEAEMERFKVGVATLDQDAAKGLLALNFAIMLNIKLHRNEAAYTTATYTAESMMILRCPDIASSYFSIAAGVVKPTDKLLKDTALQRALAVYVSIWDVEAALQTADELLESLPTPRVAPQSTPASEEEDDQEDIPDDSDMFVAPPPTGFYLPRTSQTAKHEEVLLTVTLLHLALNNIPKATFTLDKLRPYSNTHLFTYTSLLVHHLQDSQKGITAPHPPPPYTSKTHLLAYQRVMTSKMYCFVDPDES